MKEHRSQAVVIRVMDHGESDKIVTFYCPELGRLTGIAKGAKRSKKRFVNKLELFSRLLISFVPNSRSTLVRVDRAELVQAYPSIRSHYDRYAAAALTCETLLNWTKENDGDPKLFDLLTWSLERLNSGSGINESVIFFQLRMLNLMGYCPMLNGCMACGSIDPQNAPYTFLVNGNGLICNHCLTKKQNRTLSLSTVKLLQLSLDLPLTKLERLKFSHHSLIEAMDLLKRYSTFLLQREIHSWRYLTHGH